MSDARDKRGRRGRMDTIPEPWAKAMRDARVVNPQAGRPDDPSLNQLSKVSGVGPTTISKLIRGVGTPHPDTLRKLALALETTPAQIAEWAKLGRSVSEPYVPPARADWLTPRQRKAVTELILSIVAVTAAAHDDNVRTLHPAKQPQGVDDNLGQAARRAPGFAGERIAAEFAELGEGSQDPGSDEPV